jgi:class 3 adenylate cyclase
LEAPYFPVWQLTPLLPPEVDIVNLDMSKYGFLRGAMFNTLATGEASLDAITDLIDNDDQENENSSSAVFDLLIQSGQYRHQTENYEGDPLSPLIYPVFDGFGPNKQVVGVLFSFLYWRFLLSEILPRGINGVICVVENSFGQQYTYVINGEEAVFLGQGDTHDTTYDDWELKVDIAKYMVEASRPDTRSFTAVDLNDDYLNYKLRVYPSDTFQEIYLTGKAKSEATGVAGIFAVVIAIFVIYDCCVQRRQRIVMDRAVKATAVVSSLYPETIREQIINDEGNDVVKSRQSAFQRNNVRNNNGGNGHPIATKHPNCTVYFADLAGFTKWSSTREPEQVFQLLEGLFKEFDAAALRRGVFKVETIGDCYMAVTGVPLEQHDHAVRMAKFANDCQHKLEQITAELTVTLGEGTDDLALRTGMHSGEVTAGVLRGHKGRFQLFGDTVNTASRMESTGIPRKIQVSQTTADSLILEGKESWLIPRKDKIIAKGKGEMQTYFVQVKTQSTSNSSTTLSMTDGNTGLNRSSRSS